MLNDNGKLAIAELVFWVPGLLLAGIVTWGHGVRKDLGWLFIVLLGLVRIIGASCSIAAEQQAHPDSGLVVAAAITSSIGVSFMIQAVLGMINRVVSGAKGSIQIPPKGLKLLHLVLLVGIILGIVGGSKLSKGDEDDASKGLTFLRISTILFAVGLAIVALTVLLVAINRHAIRSGERRLVIAAALCLPFILVRLVFSIASVFVNNGDFNFASPNVWLRAFMAILEEFIVAAIIIATGFLTKRDDNTEDKSLDNLESANTGTSYVSNGPAVYQNPMPVNYGYAQPQGYPQGYPQRQ